MSLAEELLADLEDGDDGEADDMLEAAYASRNVNPVTGQVGDDGGLTAMETDDDNRLNAALHDPKIVSIRQICKLRDSEQFSRVMRQIGENINHARSTDDVIGPVEVDPEYQLIVEANGLAVEIDNEISTVHKFTKDKYNKRFPELESLVVSPLEYLKTARELGNDLERVKNNEKLGTFLTQATIMVVSVTASTTQGQVVSEDELQKIFEGCDMALDLHELKLKIYEYVESRMQFIAPNMSIIVGAATAAKLMGLAGGLTKLSKMPSCNILTLGSQKKILSGFSQSAMLPHTGFIYHCDLVQESPPDMRRKMARMLANKCTLAARVDASHESSTGEIGRSLREQVEKTLEKMLEPPPVKSVKALPKPVDPPRKRRGGKRVRKMKERFAVTELRKQANRTTFGDIGDDAYQEDLGYNRGTMGKNGSGMIRTAQIDEKTRVRISKTLTKNLQKQQVFGGTTTIKKQISGTASSVAFTPLQGLEIVNPQAAERRVSEANAKYFSSSGTFLNVAKPT
ncbi:U4/U6 small nuclear ribonucleoprotein Prp31 [Folsomia candida]|uniref:U4/U6 small nuclear ribonucleoprotein Prp31 n=1 Tax=Folsomia candida TaxID=158441 RepID=UPI000B90A04E|nr:U4/U6 small nuclear ribonucleoprotein Prp31 [Folsomia candida]